jgi:hypothetical protein
MGLAGLRPARVHWRHARRARREIGKRKSENGSGGGRVGAATVGALTQRFEGAAYVLECALVTAGYAALTLGAAWLLWRFVP